MLGWQCERLVQRVRVKRLRSTQHRCQRLNGHTNNVVVRLLRRERAACGLRVESKHRRTRILRMVSLGHDLVPDFSRGPIFRDLLEKIIVRIEEERKTGRKIVYVETSSAGPFEVLDAVVYGECELLQDGLSSLASVIAADADIVPLCYVLRAKHA